MQVVERVFLVGRGGWGGLEPLSAQGDCNVYLIDGGFELALVDVGVGPDCDQVRRNVVAAGFDPRRITKVLLTHTHWDHAGALPGLRRFARRALVCAHPAAAEAVREGHPYLGAGPAAKRLGAARARRIFHIDHTVREGDLIRVGEATLRVLELPGHTPDSVGWLLTVGGKKVLFSGDAAIGDQGPIKGCIGWLDVHWGSHIPTFAQTLGRLSRRRIDLLLPGHGLPIVGRERVSRSLRHCRERLEQLRRIPQLGSMLPLEPY